MFISHRKTREKGLKESAFEESVEIDGDKKKAGRLSRKTGGRWPKVQRECDTGQQGRKS